jgi:hypothetical protein
VKTIENFASHCLTFAQFLNSIHIIAGILSLLDEPISELKIFALKKLDGIVDEFWPEISEAVEKM